MSEAQKTKTKFRRSSKWNKFRSYLKKKQKVDYITNMPLLPSANCHHMDMREEHYTDLSNEDNFVMLNRRTHEMVHFLFTYYKKDHSVLLRLREILDKMEELN